MTYLDLGVSKRQAFGNTASYSRPENLTELVRTYKEGKLVLPPHPAWEGDPTDWAADPFTDKNWQFQQHTLRWLNPLRWAALEGDHDARREWVRVARAWADENIPAKKSRSPYAWKDMADGNRALQLTLGAPLVESDADWFIETLEYHRDWLVDEDNIVGKNHGLHQHIGLLSVSAILRDRASVKLAVDRMSRQFESTFDDQGANDEGSAAYHHLNMIWWKEAWERVALENVQTPRNVNERLDNAANALAHIAMPNGQIPQIGDSARGRVSRGHSPKTDFVASRGKYGYPPAESVLILDRGYILSRSGWGESRPLINESHMLVRHGEELKAHSHRDRGSIHIYAAGQRWLTDSGFHSYRAVAPVNRYLMSRAAHNVADVVGVRHRSNAEVELIHHAVTSEYHDFKLLDHGYPEHDMTRRVIYFPGADCWIVSDRANAKRTEPISQRWHVEPGLKVSKVDKGFQLSKGKKNFLLTWLGPGGTKLRHIQAKDESYDAWIGTKWRTLTPSSRLYAESSSSRPHIVTIFGPQIPLPLGIVHSQVTPKGAIHVHITRGAKQWIITIDENRLLLSTH